MDELKQLAELQGGVIYIEQVEEWLENIIEEIARRDTTNGTVKVFSGSEIISILKEDT